MIGFRTTVAALAMMAAAATAQAQTVYKVGSTPTGTPFTFLDAKTNTIQGMMVDVIEEIGKDAGFKVEIQPMQFSTLIASLTSGKIDIISAAMYGSPERAKVVDFSEDVYAYGEGLVVKSDDSKDYAGFADLKGKKVGGQIGTRYIDALKASGAPAEVGAYDSLPDILRDVSNGRLDAGIGDYPILAYNLAQGRFPQLRLVKSYKPSVPGPINIAVKQGNAELLGKINTSLANMKKDGRFETILKKWGL
ncbi:ABC transporter substrate-binding protein [Bosea sp. Root670]|jgi:polar amino acid transport system substrate-binding protein|uniref:Polar amino acid transport system substrate-binding protein n=1 Tax=Bosea robiniae TaxID=1036780 RepID=A0ABY0NAA0_9HYPH|nr:MULTISPECIES: ABC transporter substrate-binding protein [Bosea]KRE08086.1 ABC transporter substrate-binding protein [Bosea sp. Root670]SDF20240.1 polar amino acid transport system substrate-binding protein [Bosea robiniae]